MKIYYCPCCGSFTRRMWIDPLCPACETVAELLMILDPIPTSRRPGEVGRNNPFEFMSREQLEGKLAISFRRLTDRWGAQTIRARIASRGLNDWAKWFYENWLAKHEGRISPPEPSLFAALRDAWRTRQGLGERA